MTSGSFKWNSSDIHHRHFIFSKWKMWLLPSGLLLTSHNWRWSTCTCRLARAAVCIFWADYVSIEWRTLPSAHRWPYRPARKGPSTFGDVSVDSIAAKALVPCFEIGNWPMQPLWQANAMKGVQWNDKRPLPLVTSPRSASQCRWYSRLREQEQDAVWWFDE